MVLLTGSTQYNDYGDQINAYSSGAGSLPFGGSEGFGGMNNYSFSPLPQSTSYSPSPFLQSGAQYNAQPMNATASPVLPIAQSVPIYQQSQTSYTQMPSAPVSTVTSSPMPFAAPPPGPAAIAPTPAPSSGGIAPLPALGASGGSINPALLAAYANPMTAPANSYTPPQAQQNLSQMLGRPTQSQPTGGQPTGGSGSPLQGQVSMNGGGVPGAGGMRGPMGNMPPVNAQAPPPMPANAMASNTTAGPQSRGQQLVPPPPPAAVPPNNPAINDNTAAALRLLGAKAKTVAGVKKAQKAKAPATPEDATMAFANQLLAEDYDRSTKLQASIEQARKQIEGYDDEEGVHHYGSLEREQLQLMQPAAAAQYDFEKRPVFAFGGRSKKDMMDHFEAEAMKATEEMQLISDGIYDKQYQDKADAYEAHMNAGIPGFASAIAVTARANNYVHAQERAAGYKAVAIARQQFLATEAAKQVAPLREEYKQLWAEGQTATHDAILAGQAKMEAFWKGADEKWKQLGGLQDAGALALKAFIEAGAAKSNDKYRNALLKVQTDANQINAGGKQAAAALAANSANNAVTNAERQAYNANRTSLQNQINGIPALVKNYVMDPDAAKAALGMYTQQIADLDKRWGGK